jgi:hypothetical protein
MLTGHAPQRFQGTWRAEGNLSARETASYKRVSQGASTFGIVDHDEWHDAQASEFG